MTIYISGPITGRKRMETARAFLRAERVIKGAGHKAVNPYRMAPFGLSWEKYMRLAREILAFSGEIDAIYMLDGWSDSFGAMLERQWAKRKGIPVLYQTAADRGKYEKDRWWNNG